MLPPDDKRFTNSKPVAPASSCDRARKAKKQSGLPVTTAAVSRQTPFARRAASSRCLRASCSAAAAKIREACTSALVTICAVSTRIAGARVRGVLLFRKHPKPVGRGFASVRPLDGLFDLESTPEAVREPKDRITAYFLDRLLRPPDVAFQPPGPRRPTVGRVGIGGEKATT